MKICCNCSKPASDRKRICDTCGGKAVWRKPTCEEVNARQAKLDRREAMLQHFLATGSIL